MDNIELLKLPVLMGAGAALITAGFSDLKDYRIPNLCSLVLLGLFPIYTFIIGADITLIETWLVPFVVFATTFAIYVSGRLGAGDVKLLTAASLWAGPGFLAELIVVTTMVGAVLAFVSIAGERAVTATSLGPQHMHVEPTGLQNKLPYGVAIAAGGLVVLWHMI